MTHIYVPSSGPDDWRRLLADPARQWRRGFSAWALAHCWEAAAGGFPAEVAALLQRSGAPAFAHMELLLAMPEHKVALPGGGRPSQNDLFVLGKDSTGGLAAITVEGKVAEPFGPTLGEWLVDASPGKQRRLAAIQELLGLAGSLPPHIRYQLLHRTASAAKEARRFNASSALMVVHSFSPQRLWFTDFQAFVQLFAVQAQPDTLYRLGERAGVTLYAGWATGDERFLAA